MSALLDFNAETGCLSFCGELTIYEANIASGHLYQAFGSGKLRKVDLAGVTDVDTAGLQILLLAKTLRTSSDDAVSLVNPSEAVRNLMVLTNLEQT